MSAADDHADLRDDYQRPDSARTTAATALCSHGNSGAVSPADTNVDEPMTSTATTKHRRRTTNEHEYPENADLHQGQDVENVQRWNALNGLLIYCMMNNDINSLRATTVTMCGGLHW